MVKRRTFIALLAGIPFFPTSLLPKEYPKSKKMGEYEKFIRKELGRPWEVHCFDKQGSESEVIQGMIDQIHDASQGEAMWLHTSEKGLESGRSLLTENNHVHTTEIRARPEISPTCSRTIQSKS